MNLGVGPGVDVNEIVFQMDHLSQSAGVGPEPLLNRSENKTDGILNGRPGRFPERRFMESVSAESEGRQIEIDGDRLLPSAPLRAMGMNDLSGGGVDDPQIDSNMRGGELRRRLRKKPGQQPELRAAPHRLLIKLGDF